MSRLVRVPLSRRTVLRGAGGATLALPALDVMRPGRAASLPKPPKRFLICYIPLSTGARGEGETREPDRITPTTTGPDYEITPGLKGIEDSGVKAEMGLVSGLMIPWNFPSGAKPPPGGGMPEHHGTRIQQTCGYSYAGDEQEPKAPHLNGAAGPSSDQILLPIISDGSVRVPSLPLRVSPSQYEADICISSEAPDATSPKDQWGRPVGRAITPMVVLRQIFDRLFPGGAPGVNPAASAEILRRRTSILDAVRERSQVLHRRLGVQDLMVMDRYFTHIRDLEDSIKKIEPATLATCQAPPAPTSEPACSKPYDPIPGGNEVAVDKTSGWCEETLRIRAQMNLLHAAFACDLTRSSSWIMSHHQVNMYPINGQVNTMHYLIHYGGDYAAGAMNWHTEHLAGLVKLLGDSRDLDGSRIIDNTVILAFLAGGCAVGARASIEQALAQDSEYRNGGRNSHASENMIVVMAGGRNLGLRTGQHIHYDNDRHPAQVVLTAMNALGYESDVLGEMKGALPEMSAPQQKRTIVPVP